MGEGKAPTHALRPESDELWLGRGPGGGEDGVEGAGETMEDGEAGYGGRHGALIVHSKSIHSMRRKRKKKNGKEAYLRV